MKVFVQKWQKQALHDGSSSTSHLCSVRLTNLHLLALLLLLFRLLIILQGSEEDWLYMAHLHAHIRTMCLSQDWHRNAHTCSQKIQQFSYATPCQAPQAAQLVWHSVPNVWEMPHVQLSLSVQKPLVAWGYSCTHGPLTDKLLSVRGDAKGRNFEQQWEFKFLKLWGFYMCKEIVCQ